MLNPQKPKRNKPAANSGGSLLENFVESITELLKNPTAKWVTLGGAFRFFESFTIVYFMPSFFQKCYPLMKSEYAVLNGVIQATCGFVSTIGCGILADKLEKKNKMIKSQIGIIGSLLAIPAMAGCCLF